MIASVRGTLLEKGDGSCVLEAGGVGYLVHVSAHTLAALPERDSEVTLRTRQVVREDAITLFGFSDGDELRLFDLLIGVSGVGPKLALTVLSGLRPHALATAIRDGNAARLVSVPGIGRKTAERLIVELRDKLELVSMPAPSSGDPGVEVPARSAREEDAIAALVSLAYTRAQAQETVRLVAAELPHGSLEEMVRRALARMAKSAVLSRG